MNTFTAVCIAMLLWIGGALFHESDIAKNCEKTGESGAWVFSIKCQGINHD